MDLHFTCQMVLGKSCRFPRGYNQTEAGKGPEDLKPDVKNKTR